MKSSRKPDYANLERNLIKLENKKKKDLSFNNDIASLIAYQQMLCSHLGIVHTNLLNVLPQIRRPFPSLPFSNRTISMPQTSQNVKLLIDITKLLWAAVASKSDSAEIFINVHKKFNTLILTRNKFILMNPGPRINTSFKESNNEQPNDNKDSSSKIIDDFTKALNLKVKGNEKLDSSFLPTALDLQELEGRIGPEPNLEKLKSFCEDLSITEKELFNYLNEIIKTQYTSTFFKKFPDLSIISELPRFSEAINSIASNTIDVRSELNEHSKTISSTLEKLRGFFAKFENCFALPQIRFDITKHLVDIESQHYTAIRKVNFFKFITKSAKMKPPHEWTSLNFLENEYQFFQEMKSLIAATKLDEVSDLINTHLEVFARNEISEKIDEETKIIRESKTTADNQANEWLEKSTKGNIVDNQAEQKLLKNYREAQNETQEKERRNSQIRDEIYNNLTNTINRSKYLIYRLSDAPIIPPTFETKMIKLIEKDSRIELLKMKAEALRKEINNKRSEIEKLKAQSSILDKQLQQKREEYDGFKQKSVNNQNVVLDSAKSQEEYDKFKDLYYCYYHPKERREVCLRKCTHSFCKKCINIQIKERNRRCPYCQLPFNKYSDIIEINLD